jgi:DNA polymerase-3 subunit epsilon
VWESLLAGLGFDVRPNVVKKTKVLVAADPDSLSGKAKKAREYGIPIVNEAGLERLLGL